MGPDFSNSLQDYFADLTDVTLADEDSNLITTDDVNMAILGNMAMQVAPSGDQHCIETKGSLSPRIRMNFRKISERDGGSFPIQKISLHFFLH